MRRTSTLFAALACCSTVFFLNCANPSSGNGSDVGNPKLTGHLIDDRTKNAASGATVRLYVAKVISAIDSTTSDSNGAYHFDSLAQGTYSVKGEKIDNADTLSMLHPSVIILINTDLGYDTLRLSPPRMIMTDTANVSLTPTFKWELSIWATKYWVQVSSCWDFSCCVVNDSTVTSDSLTISSPLANGTMYYWRVSAMNGTVWSGWPNWSLSFRTVSLHYLKLTGHLIDYETKNAAMSAPVHLYAADGVTAIDSTISDHNGAYQFDSLPAGTYSVKGERIDNTDTLSMLNHWVTMYTSTDLGYDTLRLPLPMTIMVDSANVSLTPTLKWKQSASGGTNRFWVQVSSCYDFSCCIVNDSTVTSDSLTISSPLTNGTMYYWRVNAMNGTVWSGWPNWPSSFRTVSLPYLKLTGHLIDYETKNAAMSAPVHLYAADGVTAIDSTVSDSFGAYHFDSLAQGTYSVKGEKIDNTDTLFMLNHWVTMYTSTDLGYDTLRLPLPMTILPDSAAGPASLTPTFKWKQPASGGTTRFWVQVSSCWDFSCCVVNDSTVTSDSLTISSPLANGTMYYWRVNAMNGTVWSGWPSVASRFWTVP